MKSKNQEDKLFEQSKVKLLMRLRGISCKEASGIVDAHRTSSPTLSKDDECDGLLSAAEFFGVE